MIKKVLNTDADRRRSVTALPVGTVMLWHNDTPPDGWLLCAGGEYLINDYVTLYETITVKGTVFPYGPNTNGSGGSGSTHFRLPDMTDRFIRSSSGSSIGTTGGSANHSHNFTIGSGSPLTLNASSSSQSHSHTYSPGNFAAADSAAGHSHSVGVNFDSIDSNATTNIKRAATGNTTAAFMTHGHNASATPNAANSGHSHSITGGNGNTESGSHSHGVTITGGNYTPSASSSPASQRVYFVVFAASEVSI